MNNTGYIEEDFRDHIATVDSKGKRKWVLAAQPKGKWYTARTWVSYVYFIIFFGLPFVQVNGRPLFQFNVPEAKFILFGKIFWPQDFFLFGIIMVTFVFFIILFTAAFGRLFCGWICPQTIFMEMLFRKIEYAILGSAAKQKLLREQPFNTRKILLLAAKHISFFALAFIIANFFLAYIIGMPQLRKIITDPLGLHAIGFAAIVVFSFVFYGVYAFFREQVCTVVCPYGRLQGVLLDKNSMIVAYDYKRGEPRGFSKNAGSAFGDCVNCLQCVRVCPTGIDIRNGVQLECVGCTACIDACDAVMVKTGKPAGLIRYASENSITGGEKLKYTTRMKLYTALCTVMLILLTVLLAMQKDVKATVMRAPGMLFQERGKDSVSNLYNIKVVNKTSKEIPVYVRVAQDAGLVQVLGKPYINVQKEGQGSGSFFVVLPRKKITGRKTLVTLELFEGKQKITTIKTNFLGPVEE